MLEPEGLDKFRRFLSTENILKKNTPQLWDELWKDNSSNEQNCLTLEREERSIRWQRIEKTVLQEFGSFKDLRVIEIGAGIGNNSALMAKRGASVSVLDYSVNALKRAKTFFKNQNINAEFKRHDALRLPSGLRDRYDISMSFGLAEHFRGLDRFNIMKAHFEILRKGGITFISVPNKYNLPYRIFKFRAEYTGKWSYGEEYPFSREELKNICYSIGIQKYTIFGDSLVGSLNLIFPFSIFEKKLRLRNYLEIFRMRKQKGTFLDQYLSYALVLCGKKMTGQRIVTKDSFPFGSSETISLL